MSQYQKREDTLNHKPLQKIFLISKYLEEPKDKKDWFRNQFQNYVKTIKQNVENMTREEKYERIKKKVHLNSFSHNKISNFPKIKNSSVYHLPTAKDKLFYLKKYKSIQKINKFLPIRNDSNELSKNNSSIFNSDNYHDKSINKSIDSEYIKENAKSQIKNKFSSSYNLDLKTLPNIKGMQNKNRFIRNSINNISEKTEFLEQQLIKQEKRKYIGFKSKYNKLFNEYKKVQIDLEQYVNPKKDNKYKFNLYENNGEANEAKGGNLKKLMKQISNKLKNKHNDQPSITDIIDEVEHFKLREKLLRDRVKKSHEKFDYLINDSSIIQKRIEIKCRKNEIYPY
jgi:hypothetical protein